MTTDEVLNKEFIRTCIDEAIGNIANTGQLKGVSFKVCNNFEQSQKSPYCD